MQSASQPLIETSILNAGVDWITGTNMGGEPSRMSDELATHEFDRVLDQGGRVVPASRLGYVGYQAEGFFHGSRSDGRMMVASGATAQNLYRAIAELSDKVTRLDVQVTVWTHGEQPHLGRQAYECLRRVAHARYAVRNVQLIESHPKGETCNVGKRSSETYGRIYDKATEAGLGTPLTVWRCEVETKRRVADGWLAALRSSERDTDRARSLVWNWFTDRGWEPPFSDDPDSSTLELILGKTSHDTLRWFRESLSKTVATQIKLHGRQVVLEALGLEL